MRAKLAKSIRKITDFHPRNEREYGKREHKRNKTVPVFGKDGKLQYMDIPYVKEEIRSLNERQKYQQTKKFYKWIRRNGYLNEILSGRTSINWLLREKYLPKKKRNPEQPTKEEQENIRKMLREQREKADAVGEVKLLDSGSGSSK